MYAGAGGATHPLVRALRERGIDYRGIAVNHWQVSVDTHTANHPNIHHLCQSAENVDPRKEVPGGRLNLLLAGPECTDFSNAAGARPKNPQSRASAWHLLKWVQELYVDEFLIENVPEFRKWGPLGAPDRNGNQFPLKSKRGETFLAFITALKASGYRVESRILNAADYGDPQMRFRLFIKGVREGLSRIPTVTWPLVTHSATGSADMFQSYQKYASADDHVIDHGLKGTSIFERPDSKLLAPASVGRILYGLDRFGPPELKPFLMIMRNNQSAASLDGPTPTITGSGAHLALIEPKVIKATDEHRAAFLMHTNHSGSETRVHDPSAPVPCITGANRGELAIVEAYLLGQQSGAVLRPASQPAPTVAGGGAIAYIESFLTKYHGTSTGAYPLTEPIHTIPGNDCYALVESFLIQNQHAAQPHPQRKGKGKGIRLVRPVIGKWALEVLYRMLQPHELAAAQSFPKDYVFCGNRGQVVKQIGNAWPGKCSYALAQRCVEDFYPAAKRSKRRAA